jgi:hypothetical protein
LYSDHCQTIDDHEVGFLMLVPISLAPQTHYYRQLLGCV